MNRTGTRLNLAGVSIRWKLALIAAVYWLPIAYLLFVLLQDKNASIDFTRKESVGVVEFAGVHDLLALGGRRERLRAAGLSTAEVDTAMDRAVDALSQRAKSDPDQLHLAEGATAVTAAWQQARAGQSTGNVMDALRADASAIGDKSNLILDPDLDSYYVMDAFVLRVPDMQDLTRKSRRGPCPSPGAAASPRKSARRWSLTSGCYRATWMA